MRYLTLNMKFKPRFGDFSRIFFFCLLTLGFCFHAKPGEKDTYKIAAFGDSLTAGYGLPNADSFPFQLQVLLRTLGHNVTVINIGVSGDTAAGGLARLDWSIGDDVDAVIIELGANDALRGISPGTTKSSLEKIIQNLKLRNIDLLLTGMQAPPNLGVDYGNKFNAIFPSLARKFNLVFYPFFLKGVVGIPALNQADGLHPTAQGVKVIVQNILPKVEELLELSARHKKREN